MAESFRVVSLPCKLQIPPIHSSLAAISPLLPFLDDVKKELCKLGWWGVFSLLLSLSSAAVVQGLLHAERWLCVPQPCFLLFATYPQTGLEPIVFLLPLKASITVLLVFTRLES